MLKVAVHEDGLATLMTYGLTLNQIKNIKSHSSPIANWYYINDIPVLKKISLNQLKSIGAKKEIDRIKKEIYNSPQWIIEITKKAKHKNISVEEQINADAIYVYQNELSLLKKRNNLHTFVDPIAIFSYFQKPIIVYIITISGYNFKIGKCPPESIYFFFSSAVYWQTILVI